MDVNELLALKRPLTKAEMTFMEDMLLQLATELQEEVAKITANLDPDDPDVVKLKSAAESTLENIEAAIAVPMVPVAEAAPREA